MIVVIILLAIIASTLLFSSHVTLIALGILLGIGLIVGAVYFVDWKVWAYLGTTCLLLWLALACFKMDLLTTVWLIILIFVLIDYCVRNSRRNREQAKVAQAQFVAETADDLNVDYWDRLDVKRRWIERL